MSLSKRWCFTLNNPTDADRKKLKECEEVDYMIYQEERGEKEGTLHLQGFCILKERQRLGWMKVHVSERAHWSITRGKNEEAAAYCRKAETYTGGERFEKGTMGKTPTTAEERRERAEGAVEELKTKFRAIDEMEAVVLMQPGFIMAYRMLTADVLGPFRPNLQIITMVGPPGCGKSWCINEHFPRAGRCMMGNNGIWFQRPTADCIVFEEFNGQIPMQKMNELLDIYPYALEVKGGMRPAMYNWVVITSNTRPDEWWSDTDKTGQQSARRVGAMQAVWDRIGFSTATYHGHRTRGHYLENPPGMSIEQLRVWFDEQVRRILHPDEDEH